MLNALNKLFALMRRNGHPLVWAVLFVAIYSSYHYYQRWHWETPSIPFQPFCNPNGEYDPYRPVRGVTMTRDFAKEVVLAMAEYGVTVRNGNIFVFDGHQTLTVWMPMLVAPRDFEDDTLMMHVTGEAVSKYKHLESENIHINPEFSDTKMDDFIANSPGHFSLRCRDMEGVISEL